MDVSLRFQQEGLNELIAKTKELETQLNNINTSGVKMPKVSVQSNTDYIKDDYMKFIDWQSKMDAERLKDIERNARIEKEQKERAFQEWYNIELKKEQEAINLKQKFEKLLEEQSQKELKELEKRIKAEEWFQKQQREMLKEKEIALKNEQDLRNNATKEQIASMKQDLVLLNNLRKQSEGLNNVNNALKMTEEQQKKARVAALNLNYVLRDSPYFALDFAQGVLAIGNNINPMIDSMRALKSEANSANMSFLKMAKQSLGSGGLLTLGLSLAVSLIQGLIFAFARSKKSADEVDYKFKQFSDSVDKLSENITKLEDSLKKVGKTFKDTGMNFDYLKNQISIYNQTISEVFIQGLSDSNEKFKDLETTTKSYLNLLDKKSSSGIISFLENLNKSVGVNIKSYAYSTQELKKMNIIFEDFIKEGRTVGIIVSQSFKDIASAIKKGGADKAVQDLAKSISGIQPFSENNAGLIPNSILDDARKKIQDLNKNAKIDIKTGKIIGDKSIDFATKEAEKAIFVQQILQSTFGESYKELLKNRDLYQEYYKAYSQAYEAINKIEEKGSPDTNDKKIPEIKADWTSLYEYIAEQGDKVFPKLSTVERDYLREMSGNIKTWGDNVNKVFGKTVVEFDKTTGAWVLISEDTEDILEEIAKGRIDAVAGVSEELRKEAKAAASRLIDIEESKEKEILRRRTKIVAEKIIQERELQEKINELKRSEAQKESDLLNSKVNNEYVTYKANNEDIIRNVKSFSRRFGEEILKGIGTSYAEFNNMAATFADLGNFDLEGDMFQNFGQVTAGLRVGWADAVGIMGNTLSKVLSEAFYDTIMDMTLSLEAFVGGYNEGMSEGQIQILENFRNTRDAVMSSVNAYADLDEQLKLTRDDFYQNGSAMQMTEEARNRLKESMSPEDFEKITQYVNDSNTALEYQNKAYEETSKGVGDYVKTYLKGLAQMAAQRAAFYLAEGIFALFTFPAAAPSFFTAAGIMASVALAAGAMAGAIGSAPAAKSAPPERPESLTSSKDSKAGKGETTESKTEINVVINGDVDQQMYDKTIASLQRSADEYRRAKAMA